MGKFRDLQVGDKVWFQGRYANSGHRYLTVKKRGRKYITFNFPRLRSDIGSNIVEEPGYGCVGVLYESQEEYLLRIDREKERRALLEKLITILRDQSLETLRTIDGVIEQAKEVKND